MIEFTDKDRDDHAPKGFINFYTYPAKYGDIKLFKIGTNTQKSCKGRLAWNTYYNEGFHKFGFTGKLFDDEEGRKKITEVVKIPKIFDEVLIKVPEKIGRELELDLRKLLTPFNFPEDVQFSGRTEFVYADHNAYIIIEEYFKFLRNNYECK